MGFLDEIFSTVVDVVSRCLPSIARVGLKETELIAVLKVVVKVISAVIEIMDGDVPPPEELGDRALQMERREGKTARDFDSYEEYVEELKRFTLDPEESEKLDDNVKKAMGVAVMVGWLGEKFSVDAENLLPLVAERPGYFDHERVPVMFEMMTDQDIRFKDIDDYIHDKLDIARTLKVEDFLVSVDMEIEKGGKTEQEIRDRIQELQG